MPFTNYPILDYEISMQISNPSSVKEVYVIVSSRASERGPLVATEDPNIFKFRFQEFKQGSAVGSILDLVLDFIMDFLIKGFSSIAPLPGERVLLFANLDKIVLVDKAGGEHPYVPYQPFCLHTAFADLFYSSFDCELLLGVRGGYAAVQAYSPVDLLLKDEWGRKVGNSYQGSPGGRIVNEIPGAVYSGPDYDDEFILIASPQGLRYHITVVGTGTGTYSLFDGCFGLGLPTDYSERLNQPITTGEVQEYEVQYKYKIYLPPILKRYSPAS